MRDVARNRFPVGKATSGHRFRSITCSVCESMETINDNGHDLLPLEVVSLKFIQKGWSVSKRHGRDLCPTCQARSPKPTPVPAPVKEPPPMAAEPPRQPTREDRRRIQTALDENYLEARGCYRNAFTDKILAEKLKLPAAWVAEERERAYGPEINETRSEAAASLMAIRVRLEALESRAMQLATEAEAMRSEINQRLLDMAIA